MTRKKTTVYIDEELLRAAKIAAAQTGRREYQVFEEALRQHLGFGEVMQRIWSKIGPDQALTEQEASEIAAAELAAVRADRSVRKAG